ncbi:MAG: TetR/AcrR family transcriptional regulator, partial [Gemmataceae bacterium]
MPQRRTSKRAKKGERRQQLLDQARELFARHGYAAVTPEQIAQAAGTTPAVFARNFADMPAVA